MEKLGGEERVLLAGVCSELELGFTSGSFPRVLGKVVPLTPHQNSDQGVLEEPLVQTHPTLGQFVFPSRAGWCSQGGRGSFGTGLGVGWVLSLEGCEGGAAAPLGTWRGQARNGALPCFPPPPYAWMVLEMLVLGPPSIPWLSSTNPSAELVLLLPCPFCPVPYPSAAVTLLQHCWLGKTRGLSSMPSLPSVLVNV